MTVKNFALVGAAGYIAPRHMAAIRDTGNNLTAAYDLNDSVGVMDSYFPKSEFFTRFECFDDFLYETQKSENPISFYSVCSPNNLHESHISAGLRAGCDVICEKPLVHSWESLNRLRCLERETGQSVFNILQLRLHPAVAEIKEYVKSSSKAKHEAQITYVTSRGRWYHESWKGDPRQSFGLATNIGVHFFDMLHFVFGDLISSEVHLQTESKAMGFLEYEKANVPWMLSIDENDLPNEIGTQRTYRSITCDGKELEFSGGFSDLHTKSYSHILNGQGFGLDEAEHSVSVVESIREAGNTMPTGRFFHPRLSEM